MKLNLATQSILLIEDYPVMRKSIKDILYLLGAKSIVEAKNGQTAISAMKKQKFDIIICDYDLGKGKNGQQILEQARHQNLILFSALFIMITAHQTASIVLSALDNKPDEYLAKPFNPQQLSMRLEKCYARKKYLSSIEREIYKGNPARAIFHCDQLLAENNKTVRSQLLKIRAELAIDVGDLSKATAIYQEILTQRELLWAKLGLGIVEFFNRHYDPAIEIFQKIIEQNPMLLASYDWLAKSYIIQDHHDEAEKIIHQSTIISPHSFFRQKKLATLADKTGHLEIAEKAYLAVINLGKHSIHKSPCDFSGLAKVYSIKNENKQAIKILNNMQQQFPNNPEATLRAAVLETKIYQDMGENELSEQAYQKTLELNQRLKHKTPKDLQLEIAKACYTSKDDEIADKIVATLINNHIDDRSFLDDIRGMHNDMGYPQQAERLIQQTRQELVKINNKGVKLYQQGQVKEAYIVLEQAIQRMPDNQTILLNMLKITLHDLKTSGINKQNLLLANRYLKKAKQIGMSQDKLGALQMEFETLTHSTPD